VFQQLARHQRTAADGAVQHPVGAQRIGQTAIARGDASGGCGPGCELRPKKMLLVSQEFRGTQKLAGSLLDLTDLGMKGEQSSHDSSDADSHNSVELQVSADQLFDHSQMRDPAGPSTSQSQSCAARRHRKKSSSDPVVGSRSSRHAAVVESFSAGRLAVKAECAGKSVFFRMTSSYEVVDRSAYETNNSLSVSAVFRIE
jgi:hypothetical protein